LCSKAVVLHVLYAHFTRVRVGADNTHEQQYPFYGRLSRKMVARTWSRQQSWVS